MVAHFYGWNLEYIRGLTQEQFSVVLGEMTIIKSLEAGLEGVNTSDVLGEESKRNRPLNKAEIAKFREQVKKNKDGKDKNKKITLKDLED